jgi:hypothetical protein
MGTHREHFKMCAALPVAESANDEDLAVEENSWVGARWPANWLVRQVAALIISGKA